MGQHWSALVSMGQHWSAWVSMDQQWSTWVSIGRHGSADHSGLFQTILDPCRPLKTHGLGVLGVLGVGFSEIWGLSSQRSGFWVLGDSGFGFGVEGLPASGRTSPLPAHPDLPLTCFRASIFGFRVSSFGLRVSGLGFS